MDVFVSGAFGRRVAAELLRRSVQASDLDALGTTRGIAFTAIVMDYLNADALERWRTRLNEVPRWTFACPTPSGVLVGPDFAPGNPCFTCFDKRWRANLAGWLHSSSQEKSMRRLFSSRPELCPDANVSSAVLLVADGLLDQALRPRSTLLYFNLLNARLEEAPFSSVHGCRCATSCGAAAARPSPDALASLIGGRR